jgi:hypothetical protein
MRVQALPPLARTIAEALYHSTIGGTLQGTVSAEDGSVRYERPTYLTDGKVTVPLWFPLCRPCVTLGNATVDHIVGSAVAADEVADQSDTDESDVPSESSSESGDELDAEASPAMRASRRRLRS